jgi:hypothetical protein
MFRTLDHSDLGGTLRRRALALLALLALSSLAAPVLAGADLQRAGALPHLQTAAPSGRVVVKLDPASGLVMDRSGLAVRPGAPDRTAAKAADLGALVRSLAPGARLEKRIPTAPVKSLAGAGDPTLPDLALYAHFQAGTTDRDQLLKIIVQLADHPDVLTAFLEPVAVPAALGFDAFTGATPAAATEPSEVQPASLDFEYLQGYLDDAPLGIGAWTMRPVAGQRGAGVSVIDIEGAWLWAHEDLPDPFADLGVHVDDAAWRNHGTAVMGEIRGIDNGFGVTGITPDCAVGNSSIGGSNTAAALAAAIDALQPGDLILIELHAPGPRANGEGQFGYLPMEYWQDNFDAIRLATSRGILVCEAAGNGYQNLDDDIYLDLFDRQVRDSGAIMCGATAGSELHSADFSNHGQRVDLNGWGWYVTTAGYGDLAGEFEEEFYTGQFSGTSSASPIVTGAVASLQGMVRQLHGFDLDARLARDLLRETGTPMEYGTLIGTRPDLVAAHDLAAGSIGRVTGTVTDQQTGQPLAQVMVRSDSGAFTATNEAGAWSLPLRAGPATLEFTSFFYRAGELSVTVPVGDTATRDMALEALPLIGITGTVFDEEMAPLDGVTVSCTNQPVDGAVSGADGVYLVDQVPADHIYQLRWDGRPGYGAQVMNVDTEGFTGNALASLTLPLVSEDFETDDGGFTSLQGLWSYGPPPADITGGAFGGDLCWGVGMDGDYGDDESDQLTSPVFDLSGVTATSYQLSFHFYCATEPGFDGVNLEVSANGGPFSVLHPLDGYTDLSLGGLVNQPGWAGDSGRWTGAVFDITEFVGGDFQFRLNWGSDAGVTGQGFYVDSIAFGSGARVTPAAQQTLPTADRTLVRSWPNPFNPQVTLEFSLPEPGYLEVVVFDVAGRKVRTLLQQTVAEPRGSVVWDGRDGAGRMAASGTYFVLVSPTSGASAVSKVVLAK